eukprot:g23985.t1
MWFVKFHKRGQCSIARPQEFTALPSEIRNNCYHKARKEYERASNGHTNDVLGTLWQALRTGFACLYEEHTEYIKWEQKLVSTMAKVVAMILQESRALDCPLDEMLPVLSLQHLSDHHRVAFASQLRDSLLTSFHEDTYTECIATTFEIVHSSLPEEILQGSIVHYMSINNFFVAQKILEVHGDQGSWSRAEGQRGRGAMRHQFL